MTGGGAAIRPTRVSAVIPVYNRSRFLPLAVQSLLATGYPALEIVIVDDGSTDGTLEAAAELAAAHPQVRLLRHPDGGNHGSGPTRNRGIREATGAYICFLDSDDRVLPHRFTRAVGILDADGEIDGVYEWTINEQGAGGRTDLRRIEDFDCPHPGELLRTILTVGRYWHTSALLARREILLRCGGFSERLRLGQDLVLWLKLAASARLVRGSTEPVSVYHLHGGNISTRNEPTRHFLTALNAYLEAYDWVSRNGTAENRALLRNATLKKCYLACHGCRSNGRPDQAAALLFRTAGAIPAILGERKFWKNLLLALKERAVLSGG